MKKKIFLFLILFTFVNLLKAEEIKENAGLIFPVLSIYGCARAEGMAGAFTAIADDVTATYLNPAGLSQIKNMQLAFLFNKWFMDSFIGHIMTAGLNLGPGKIGADIFYIDYGTFELIKSPYIADSEKINPFSLFFTLSYGIGFGDNFSIGLSGKYLMQSLAKISYTGYGGDLGLIYKIEQFSAGLAVKNFGTGGSYNLPLSINSGLAYKILDTPLNLLIFSSDFNYNLNSKQEIKAGIEYGFRRTLFLRAGYKYNFADDYLKELKGISLGIGFAFSSIELNYAFLPYGELGIAHNIMISFVFGGKSGVSSEKPVKPEKTSVPVVEKVKKTKEELFDMLATGGSYENSGKLDMAEKQYKEILKYDETYADAWKRLGAVYYKKKMVKEAIECFEKYLKLKPDDMAVKKWLEKNKK